MPGHPLPVTEAHLGNTDMTSEGNVPHFSSSTARGVKPFELSRDAHMRKLQRQRDDKLFELEKQVRVMDKKCGELKASNKALKRDKEAKEKEVKFSTRAIANLQAQVKDMKNTIDRVNKEAPPRCVVASPCMSWIDFA